MPPGFDRASLLAALDEIGAGAAEHGTRLELLIYGGSAWMLASNFRFATEDVDIAELRERPAWLSTLVADIARRRRWSEDWLNDAIAVHLSRETREQDQDSCLETAAKRSAETQPTRGRRQPTTVGPLVPNRKATREKREMIGVFGVSSLS